MFNLNENNRIVMSQHPTDMRMGINCLCGQVRMVGLEPANGEFYIFVGKSRKVMKMASKASDANQPGLFDELFDQAYDERAA